MINTEHMDPARSLIALFGDGNLSEGVKEIARATGRHESRVYRWMYPEGRGGTDGLIPQQNFLRISLAAASRGIEVPTSAFTNSTAPATPPVHSTQSESG